MINYERVTQDVVPVVAKHRDALTALLDGVMDGEVKRKPAKLHETVARMPVLCEVERQLRKPLAPPVEQYDARKLTDQQRVAYGQLRKLSPDERRRELEKFRNEVEQMYASNQIPRSQMEQWLNDAWEAFRRIEQEESTAPKLTGTLKFRPGDTITVAPSKITEQRGGVLYEWLEDGGTIPLATDGSAQRSLQSQLRQAEREMRLSDATELRRKIQEEEYRIQAENARRTQKSGVGARELFKGAASERYKFDQTSGKVVRVDEA